MAPSQRNSGASTAPASHPAAPAETSMPTSSDAASSPSTSPSTDPAANYAAAAAARARYELLLKNDPARTGYDPSISWWMNYFRVLSGQMTREGQFHFREDSDRSTEAADVARCEEYRDWLFAYSPTVRFLREKIAALNGDLGPTNVVCRRCPTRVSPQHGPVYQGGGFSPDHGILICANHVANRAHLEETLSHEMVHAWDQLRWKVDFAGEKDLRHAACTEIRASMLSGECRWWREFHTRGNRTLTMQFQDCVRRRAILSVMSRSTCKDDVQATKVVNEVWDSCFRDTRPFDEVYR